MNIKNTYSIAFLLRTAKVKKGKTLIYCRASPLDLALLQFSSAARASKPASDPVFFNHFFGCL